MRRPVQRTATKLSADIRRLVALTQTTMAAVSSLEKHFWQHHLNEAIVALLSQTNQNTLDTTLDYLFQQDGDVYDTLVESIEQCSQSCTITQEQQSSDVLLIAAPVLAWTRFSINSGILPDALITALKQLMHTHIFAEHATITISPSLHAIEQLPQHHSDVFELMQLLANPAFKKKAPKPASEETATIPFLADTRYLIATVTVPHQAAVFRWQTGHDPLMVLEQKIVCEHAWAKEALPLLAPALPGCNLELLLPQAYFYSCREADKRIRPATIRAATHYLTHHLKTTADQLKVSIGKCSHDMDGEIDEYRIGFTLNDDDNIYYGTVWPLYENEDGDTIDPSLFPEANVVHPFDAIRQILRECGITDIKEHVEIFDAEFCDDCGSPLFPNLEGDLVHAEMPEETSDHIEQLH